MRTWLALTLFAAFSLSAQAKIEIKKKALNNNVYCEDAAIIHSAQKMQLSPEEFQRRDVIGKYEIISYLKNPLGAKVSYNFKVYSSNKVLEREIGAIYEYIHDVNQCNIQQLVILK